MGRRLLVQVTSNRPDASAKSFDFRLGGHASAIAGEEFLAADFWALICKVILWTRRQKRTYKFEPKASRRPSQSFTTNSRECQGMFPSSRVNSTPLAAYSA